MPRSVVQIAVVARSHPPATRWSTRVLRPWQVLPLVPATPPRTRLSEENGVETWYLGPADVVLYSGEAAHYRDNLESGRPSIWVAMPQTDDPLAARVQIATVDPYEGEGLAGDVSLVVEALPIPAPLLAELAAFTAAHFAEIPFEKRKRKRVDLETDPRAPRILRPEDKWGGGR